MSADRTPAQAPYGNQEEPWTRWTISVCSECNEPTCEVPSEPVSVEVVPLEDALAEVERLRAALRRQVAGRDAEARRNAQ